MSARSYRIVTIGAGFLWAVVLVLLIAWAAWRTDVRAHEPCPSVRCDRLIDRLGETKNRWQRLAIERRFNALCVPKEEVK